MGTDAPRTFDVVHLDLVIAFSRDAIIPINVSIDSVRFNLAVERVLVDVHMARDLGFLGDLPVRDAGAEGLLLVVHHLVGVVASGQEERQDEED